MIRLFTLTFLACLFSIASFAIGPINGTDSVCVGSTRTLTDVTTGGVWSSSNTSVATIGSSTGIVTGVAAGITTISYVAGTATVTATFVVNPVAAPISGSTTVVAGAAITLSDAVTGGAWYTSNASVASVGSATGVVTGVAAGSCTIYYVTAGGCGTYIVFTVTGSTSVSGINGIASVCVGQTRTLTDSTSGGHWSSSNTTVATVGSSTGVVTGVGAGTCTITYMVGTAIATITFTVNPAAAPISGITTVAVGGTTTLSDAVSGGTWTCSSSSIATVGSTTGIVTGVSPGTLNIYYQTPGGCFTYIIVTVTATSSVGPINGTANVCQGSTRTLTDATTGGVWSSSNTSVATVGSSTGIVTGVGAGICTITYTVGTAIATVTFAVNPVAPITGGSTVAVGGTLTLSDAVSGGSWITSDAAVATVGSASGIVTGVAPGTVTIYYRTSAPCYSYIIVTVTATSSVSPINGTANACEGSTRTLTDATSGGYWSSSNTSVATVGSSTGIVTGVAAGTCTITYTVGTAIATITFTVNPAAAPISGTTTVAVGSTVTLSDAVSGGSWFTSNASVATVGSTSGDVTGVSTGTVSIYYRTPGGCYTYVIVTVTPTTSIHGISGTASVCVGGTRTLSDSTSGGHWSSSNTSVATVGSSTGIVTGVSAGTCTITYAVGSVIATITFTVNAASPISGSTTIAVGSSTTFSDAVAGGTWISSNASVATVGSLTGLVTGVAAGTATIYYVNPAGCGAYVIVTVTGTTAIHGISGTASVCEGLTRTLSDSTAGGYWSSSNSSIATVGSSTGIVTGVAAGTCTITYSVGSAIATITFTVNPAAAPISGSTTLSVGSTVTLSDAISGGAWFTSNASIAGVGSSTGVVSGVSAGTATIYYRTPGGCYTYVIVTVTSTVAIHGIHGTANVCVGLTRTLSDSTAGGHWSSSNTAIATVGSSTGIVTGVSAGTCTITYSVGSGFATITFTVNAASPILGSTTLPAGSSVTLSDAASGGTWISSNTSVATVGSSTGVVTGVAAGTATIYYVNPSGCGAYVVVTVTPTTSIHGIHGTEVVCVGGTRTLSDSTTGGHWSSSNPGIATVGSTSGVVTGISAGTCTITYTVGAGYVTITFTVSPLPGPISGGTSVAIGGTLFLSDAVSGGTWVSSNSSVASIGSSSGILTGIAAGSANIYYLTPGGCGAYVIVTVTGGVTTLHGIHGTTNACAGMTRTLTDSTSGGHWTSSNTAIATVGSASGVVTAIAAGTATITYTVGASITTITFTVNPDAGPITGSSSVTTGTTTLLTDSTVGGTWSTSNAAVASVGASSGIVLGVAAGTANIYYETPGGCYTHYIMTVIASPGFTLYPNPAAESVYLSWQDQTITNGTVTVSDMAGHVVYTSAIDMSTPGGQMQIPVSGLMNGIYLYDIVSGNTHTTGRIYVVR